jgi:hypothetical protein
MKQVEGTAGIVMRIDMIDMHEHVVFLCNDQAFRRMSGEALVLM